MPVNNIINTDLIKAMQVNHYKQRRVEVDKIIVYFLSIYVKLAYCTSTMRKAPCTVGRGEVRVLRTCCSSLLYTRVLSLSGSPQNEQLAYGWLFWKGISRNAGGRLGQVKQRRRESQSKNILLSWSLLWGTGPHPPGDPLRSHVEYISELFALRTTGGLSSSWSKKVINMRM